MMETSLNPVSTTSSRYLSMFMTASSTVWPRTSISPDRAFILSPSLRTAASGSGGGSVSLRPGKRAWSASSRPPAPAVRPPFASGKVSTVALRLCPISETVSPIFSEIFRRGSERAFALLQKAVRFFLLRAEGVARRLYLLFEGGTVEAAARRSFITRSVSALASCTISRAFSPALLSMASRFASAFSSFSRLL